MLKPTAPAAIRHARHEKDWTLERLSQEAGVSIATIVSIEKAHHSPHGRTIYRLAKALDLNPLDLFEEEVPA
jgi:transcriptional regulator with XRE-family HTH domain